MAPDIGRKRDLALKEKTRRISSRSSWPVGHNAQASDEQHVLRHISGVRRGSAGVLAQTVPKRGPRFRNLVTQDFCVIRPKKFWLLAWAG
jgi:hypothetical protein